MNQNQVLLRHLKRRTITPKQAYDLYGIMRLSERIRELMAQGHNIARMRKRITNRYGKSVYVGWYIWRGFNK